MPIIKSYEVIKELKYPYNNVLKSGTQVYGTKLPGTASVALRFDDNLHLVYEWPVHPSATWFIDESYLKQIDWTGYAVVLECPHEWLKYEGLIEIYDYCKKCDEKKR